MEYMTYQSDQQIASSAGFAVFARKDGAVYTGTHNFGGATVSGVTAAAAPWVDKGTWLTTTVYAVSDVVTSGTVRYVCIVAHTSGTFATDLAAGKWLALGLSDQLFAANNLSDVANVVTARTNLGLGTAATLASTAVAQTANNLSDLTNVATARTNLGLGTAATQASTAFAPMIEAQNTVAASGAAQTIPAQSTASVNYITLTANCTLTFPTAGAGEGFTLVLQQDGTGSRTVTWPGTVKWAGGTAPTLTTAINKADAFTFLCVDGTNWLGFTAGLNF